MSDSRLPELRRLFPVTERYAYLDHAADGPLPAPAVSALTEFIRHSSREGAFAYAELEGRVEATRALVARLMRVKTDAIALTKNTTTGILIAIGSIEWREGDNMIIMKDAFPADYYPYQLLLPRVEKRYVTSLELAEGPDCVFRLIDRRTRAVALDWVSSFNGVRCDIAAVAEFCRPLGIRTIVDAVQGLGVVDLDFGAAGADFVCSSANKWLLSPQGTGLLCVRPEILRDLKPYNLGWLSARWDTLSDYFGPKPLKSGAARYEEGTKNYSGIYAMHASLSLLLDVGVSEVAARNRRLNDGLRKGLLSLGFAIHTPEEPLRSAGILVADKPGTDVGALHQRLAAAGVVCSLRENRLRISPHFYNTDEEADRLLEVLRS